MLPWVALGALALAAAAAWRVSRPISLALAAVVASSLAYTLLAALLPEAHAAGRFEAQRWVSALVGLVGVYELSRFVRMHRRFPLHIATSAGSRRAELAEDIWRCRRNAPGALAVLCLASMVSDGAAWLFFRARWPWVGDAAALVFSAAALVICRPWRSR